MAELRPQDLLRPSPAGLYCPPGDFYIDPMRPVSRAVVTHGHSDHARAGHEAVIATAETLAVMRERLGENFAGATEAARYGESIVRDGVAVRFVPAGHILGSAQIVMSWKGLTIVVSGDYKRRRDPTCPAFEPVRCNVFVSEATFGLPVFRHPPDSHEIASLLKSVSQFPERTHFVGAYSLGKAQRVIRLLREARYDKTIYVHDALDGMNAVYESFGVSLGPLAPVAEASRAELAGAVIIAPPMPAEGPWAKQFSDPLIAFASGWMGVRARARQRQVELPLVISDHADWDELTGTVNEIEPHELWITHGNEEALLRWAELNGQNARALSMVGYEEDSE